MADNVITLSEYLTLSDLYGDAYALAAGTSENFYAAAYDVVLYQKLYPELDLLNPLWDAYQINISQSTVPLGIMGAVQSINQHVLKRSGQTLNQFIPDTSISLEWYNLCILAGFTVDAAKIKP
jgi:hypothetical protein